VTSKQKVVIVGFAVVAAASFSSPRREPPAYDYYVDLVMLPVFLAICWFHGRRRAEHDAKLNLGAEKRRLLWRVENITALCLILGGVVRLVTDDPYRLPLIRWIGFVGLAMVLFLRAGPGGTVTAKEDGV
jgi:hypothetical protein